MSVHVSSAAELYELVSRGEIDKREAVSLAREMKRTGAPAPTGVSGDVLRDRVCDVLADKVRLLLKVGAEDLDVEVELGEYGLDSVVISQLVSTVNDELGLELKPTVVFEHPTLAALASHLVAEHGAGLADRLGLRPAAPSPAAPETAVPETSVPETSVPAPRIPRTRTPAPQPQAKPATAPSSTEPETADPVAIVGISGRFPQADDVDAFWRNLSEGRDCISEVPADRWDWRELYGDPFDDAGRTNVKWGGFMDGVADFDPEFFGIAPKEAALMDPQQRLLMLYVWKALEDAGYAADALAGTDLAIIAGTANTGYERLIDAGGRRADGVAATATVPSIGPNRMSFFLDVHGPSEPVETACSSSLVALHRAVAALERGECSLAVVGGVNTLLVPDGHISFGRVGMLSEDGRCKTFSDRANGYARGEGVGMLVLKRLSAAERDGDHIYGAIRGTAANHGGRANSLTSPNPKAQAAVIRAAHRKAGIDPRTIGYVEAHGTGTKLGDPIEIGALAEAFRDLYADRGAQVDDVHCGVGSVKTNIGHLELSAGVAGVIKVLLQMRHRTLVQSLHSEPVNPYIELEDTPFYLVRERRPWPAPVDDTGAELPRRAGVSSFGFGGVNAHVVLEEYVPPVAPVPEVRTPVAVVLSANDSGTLTARAEQLLAWIDETGLPDDDLPRVAHTLQVGRVAMPERLAFVAGSVAELQARLKEFVAGDRPKGLHRGHRDQQPMWRVLAGDEDIATAMDSWVDKGKLDRLLELWATGFDFDWKRLHRGAPPRRIPLPTYPFHLRRYWVADAGNRPKAVPPEPVETCHRAGLIGEEDHVRDHRVHGTPLLPGVAQLALVGDALGVPEGFRLHDVAWLRPIQVTGPCQVEVRWEPADGEQRSFELCVRGDERTVHATGVAQVGTAPDVPAVDVRALVENCQAQHTGAECYELFERIGISYGPALRTIDTLHCGEGLAVARLHAPRSAGPGLAMLDGALQTCLGLWLAEHGDPQGTEVPFAVREFQVLSAMPGEGWAVVRRTAEANTLDIDLCDTDGNVCARWVGFSTRATSAPTPSPRPQARTHLLAPVWDAVRIEKCPQEPAAGARVLLLGGTEAEQAEFRRRCPGAVVLDADDAASADAVRLQPGFEHVVWVGPADIRTAFRLVKAVLAAGADAGEIGWTVLTRQARQLPGDTWVEPSSAGAHGLFGSLAKEYPHWPVRVVDVSADQPVPWDDVLCLPTDQGGRLLAHRHGEWYRQRLLEVPEPEFGNAGVAPPPGDVVVAIGGAGGIGAVWTEHVMRRHQARVVWIGRRPLDAEIEARRQALAAFGPAPEYVQADATDLAALCRAREEIVRRHGPVRGVLHSALVLGDQRLAAMDEERFDSVYSAKVDVAANIAEAFGDQPLDFAVFFSSLQSFAPAAGQANYAAGCTFSDAFAEHLATRLECPVKTVNWGYWGGVGVVASPAHRARMAEAGVASIEPEDGMAAYDALMASPHDQLALLKTTGPHAVGEFGGGDTLDHQPAPVPSAITTLRDNRPDRTGEIARLRAKSDEHVAAMEATLARITWSVLRSLGLFGDDRAATAAEQRAEAAIAEHHDGWLRHTLAVLTEAGYLHQRGEGRCARTGDTGSDLGTAWAEWDRERDGWLADEGKRAQAVLVDTSLRALADVLTGRRPATDVLFPDSSVELVEGVYRDSPVAGYFNQVLADTAEEYVRCRLAEDPDAKLRILEIGAGTGGTSAAVFRALEPWADHVETYCYTDISKVFLLHARRTYGDIAPYLDTQLFDVEQPLAGQSVPAGGFDLVIAANVLHATRDIRTTLRNTKAALRAGGVLLLNELSTNSLFSHLTFGLLDGWWRYDDPAPRISGSPALAPATWCRLLGEAGFRGAFVGAEDAGDLGQQVMVAESDGVVRQPAAPHPTPEDTGRAQEEVVTSADLASPDLEARITELMAGVLELDPERLGRDVPLRQHGFDSIFLAQFLAQVKKHIGEAPPLDVVAECETVQDVIDRITDTTGRARAPESRADFPELVRMNSGGTGRPVFWIHHGNGGVELYRPIAERSGRPFYGIQPKGWAGSGEILTGQVPMARHYASVIRAVQPEGPYDVGGFSVGGLLAYEVVRQLQLQGAEVNSLVMLDSLDATSTNRVNEIVQGGRDEPDVAAKVSAFRAVNLVLGNNQLNADAGTSRVLHRDAVDPGLSYPEFFDSLIAAAARLTAGKTDAQLRSQVEHLVRYFEVLHTEKHVVHPLPRRDAVRCYYVRNRSGVFFGNFEEYMVLHPNPDIPSLDGTAYWREWEEQIDDFFVTEVDTTSHADVVVAPQSLNKILRLCDELYGEGR